MSFAGIALHLDLDGAVVKFDVDKEVSDANAPFVDSVVLVGQIVSG